MNSEQQKAYDIGYKTYTTGVALTGGVRVDRTAFTTNNYQAFGGDFSLTSSLYDYYVKGFNQAKSDATVQAGTGTLVKILLVGAALGMIFFFKKKK